MTPAPYEKVRPTGRTWLVNIPSHWQLLRNKYLLKEISNLTETGTEELLTVSQYTGVTPRRVKIDQNQKKLTNAESLIGYKLVQKDDIVMNIMLAWNGSLGSSKFEGIVSPAYCVYRSKDTASSHYLHYLYRTPLFTGLFKTVSTGVVDSRLRLYPDVFLRLETCLPPPNEQQAIVRFLDYKCAQINKFIQKKKRLIELLKEQKQAIINQAVTRGLDPNVRLKPSGVEWLGDIPKHWEIQRLRFIGAKFGSGVTPKGGASVYSKNGIPFLRSQNIHFDGLMLQDVVYINENIHQFMLNTHVKPNDVLLNITGASIGRVCCVPAEFKAGNVNQHVCIIRPKLNIINPEYLAKYLSCSSIQKEIVIGQNGASREGLTLKTIKSIPIVLPPLNEQLEIVHYCSNELEEINALIKKLTQQIELVQEYRTRLISDVVTGQIDVRNIEFSDSPENELTEEALEEEQEEESLELIGAGDDD